MSTSGPAATGEEVRGELRAWLTENWDPELSLVEWRARLADAGWACPTWPERWCGRGLAPDIATAVKDELNNAGAVGIPDGIGMGLAAPTILEHASDDVKERFLRRTVTGELSWCQLFSEPGAGSDLAGLTTRAERDGDQWIVNGQKVWNTSAHHADVGLLLARTDWGVPKHRGITCLIIPMRIPQVEVRPLRQMNGHASFNEVFFTDAPVPIDDVIGEVGAGWSAALTTLAHERRLAPTWFAAFPNATPGRATREAAAEAAIAAEPYTWYPQRAGRPDLVVERARQTGRNTDPVIRQQVAQVVTLQRVAQWTQQRALAARALGRPPGPEGSLGKLASSVIARASARVHAAMTGAEALLTGSDSPLDGTIAEIIVSVPAVSIAGGTDEIQHNILGERILGLPKEPQVDRDQPFRDVPHNAGRDELRRVLLDGGYERGLGLIGDPDLADQ
jgi:alkylation response protein AidB-like acyl-CoA dehydrogenase